MNPKTKDTILGFDVPYSNDHLLLHPSGHQLRDIYPHAYSLNPQNEICIGTINIVVVDIDNPRFMAYGISHEWLFTYIMCHVKIEYNMAKSYDLSLETLSHKKISNTMV